MKWKAVGHFGRRALAILLAVAFVFSGMNVTGWQVKAAEDKITVTGANDTSKAVHAKLTQKSTIAAGTWGDNSPAETLTEYAVEIVNGTNETISDWELTIACGSLGTYNAGWNGVSKSGNKIVVGTYKGTGDDGVWTNATIAAGKSANGAGFQVAARELDNATYTLTYKQGESSGSASVDDTATDPSVIGSSSDKVKVSFKQNSADGVYHEYFLQIDNQTSDSIGDWIVAIPIKGVTKVEDWSKWAKIRSYYTSDYLYIAPVGSAVISGNSSFGSLTDDKYKFNYCANGEPSNAIVYYKTGTSSSNAFDSVINNANGGSSGGGGGTTGSGGVQGDTTTDLNLDVEYNFAKLLQEALYFYDANMCGELEGKCALDWRKNCHLADKTTVTYDGQTIDVSGGFHDAGDHDKFGLPQGYTASILGLGYYEFKEAYEKTGQSEHFKTILDYFCDYFVRCTVLDDSGNAKAFCYQVGDGASHNYWVSAEKENINRPAYFADSSTPATDQVSEAVAALAIHYVNFGNEDYLDCAKKLFAMAQKNSKKTKSTDGGGFYNSSSWVDDYCLAAAWLYKATKINTYLDEYKKYEGQIDTGADPAWDQIGMYAKAYGGDFSPLAANASQKINSASKVSNGYMWMSQWGSARYNCNVQLEGLIYDKNSGKEQQYTEWATGQMKFLLGNSEDKRCYIVGYNANSSKYPHHRTSSGYSDWPNNGNNHTIQAHVLLGALVGGIENTSGVYHDDSNDYYCNEVAIDYNAAFTGAAAGLYLANLDNSDIKTELATEEELSSIGVTKYYGASSADSGKVTGVKLDPTTLSLAKGESANLTATVSPSTAADKTVTWKSDKEAVATVDETGKVTAKASGTAIITATVGSGANAVTARCSVTVTKNTPKVTVPESITVVAGSKLSDITFDEKKFYAEGVAGTFSWKTADKTLTIKDNNTTVEITFTPSDATAYDSVDKVITILVTKKKYDSVPGAPKLSSATANTVTLVKDTGAIPVQYGIKQGTDYKWQKENVFTGLSEYTAYEFAMCYSETDIYEASEAGKALKVTTFFNDTNKYKVDLTKLTEENYVESHGGTITYDADAKVLTLTKSDKAYTITGSNPDVEIDCLDGVTVKLKGAESKSLSGDGTLTVQLENKSKVAEGIKAEKIVIENGGTTGVGSLVVSSGENNAAIDAPEITINSGEINATGTGEQKAIKATQKEGKGVLELLGGIVTANAESEPPIEADKIILDGGQVISNADTIYSTTPVDGDGVEIDLCYVTYKNGENSEKASIKKGSEIELSSLPAKEGYKANGWKLEGDDTATIYIPGTKMSIDADVTFVADYTEITGDLEVSVSKAADLVAGYKTDSGVAVTITNNTNVTIDKIELVLDNDKKFTISEDEIIGLEAEDSAAITVALKNGMGVGTYSTDLTITCMEGECAAIAKTITRVVGKATAEKPDKAPEILKVTANSVTLVPVTDKTIEYGIKQADDSYKWQPGNEFTALKSYTTYSFAIRYKETASTNASEASDSVSATTLMDEKAKYIVDLTRLDEKGYVEAHDGSITYDADKKELTLVEEETYTITGNNPDIKIIVKETATLNLENTKVQAVEADKDIELVLKGTSSVTSTVDGQPAIKAEGSVTISQTEGAVGSVQATGGDNAAGIEAAEVTIKSGTVTVTGGKDASGIVADKVTVSDGTVAITGQGDKPAVKADTTKFDVPVKTTNGSNYKEEGGDTSEEDKTTQKPDDTTGSQKSDSSETQSSTTQKAPDTGGADEDEDDDKEIKPALLCSNILLQKGKSIRLQTNDDDVEITKVAYANKKSKKLVNASSSGKVTGKKTGTASLKVTYEYDDVSYTKTVKVKVQKNQVVSLTKKTISLTLKRNKKANLVNPSNMLSSKGMKFTSSNKRCVKVSSSGVVKARKKGSANVTVKIGKTKYTVKIKVK